jgi:HK97 family phage prohead protease
MALQGRAITFNEIIPNHHGENKLLLPGTFDWTLESGNTVTMLFGGHDGPSIGSIQELHSDHDGLFFRFVFPDTDLGRKGREIAEANEPSTLSIGFDYRNAIKSKRFYDGSEVMVVRRARLWDITWIVRGRGADEHAFASYENVGSTSLADDCRSGKLMYDFAAVGVRRALRRLTNSS